jgi:AcrR family transcriptional regulator
MTSVSPRRQATRKRRRDILDAALACFLQNGFEAATIEHIRDASGASFGSIYYHFGSKQEIAAAVYEEGVAELENSLEEVRRGQTDVREGLRAQVQTYFDWLWNHKAMALFLFRVSTADQAGHTAEQINSVNFRSQQSLTDWLRPFAERGEIVEMPTALYDTVVFGPCSHFARHWLVGREELDFADVVEHLSESIIRSLCIAK